MAAATCASRSQRDKVVLLLNWYMYSEHAPFYLGKEKGYFDAEGIDLEIQEGRGSGPTVQAVAAGPRRSATPTADDDQGRRQGRAGAERGRRCCRPARCRSWASPRRTSRSPTTSRARPSRDAGRLDDQIWPLFLKKTGLKEGDFKVVAGDAQTKLNAVINGQADLLLGYVMDQNIKLGRDREAGVRDPLRRLRRKPAQLRRHRAQGDAEANADLVKRFMRAADRRRGSREEPEGRGRRAAQGQPKAGKRDRCGRLEADDRRCYHTKDDRRTRPFRVADANMNETSTCWSSTAGSSQRRKGKAEDYLHQRLPAVTARGRATVARITLSSTLTRCRDRAVSRSRRHKTYRTRTARSIAEAARLRHRATASSCRSSARRLRQEHAAARWSAGLLPPQRGEHRGRRHGGRGPPDDIGIVFQSPVLLAWRKVLDNIMLQIEMRRLPRAQYLQRARGR